MPHFPNTMYVYVVDAHFIDKIEEQKILDPSACDLMHLIPIISFKLGHVSIPKRRTFPPLFLFCACDRSVLQNFKIFTH
jgi:hypothetical protein